MPSTEDFRTEIEAQIVRAKKQGRPHHEVNAGELHRLLGGYPASGSHSMPKCCSAMREILQRQPGEVIFETDSGQSASLTIRYYL